MECSPVERVNFVCGNYINAGTTIIGKNEMLTYAKFQLKGNESYIRAECIDKYGKTAWTNPIFLNFEK